MIGKLGRANKSDVNFAMERNLRMDARQGGGCKDKGSKDWYLVLLVAKLASSSGVNFSLLTLVCSDVLTDTEVSLK